MGSPPRPYCNIIVVGNGLINAEVWDRGILVSKAPVFEEIYSNHSQQQSQDGVMSPSSDSRTTTPVYSIPTCNRFHVAFRAWWGE